MTSEEGTHVERTSAQWKNSLKGENEHLRKQILLVTLPTATKANQNICHNLILSSKPIATPRKKEGRDPCQQGLPPPDIRKKNSDIANKKE